MNTLLAAVCQLPSDLTPEHTAWSQLQNRLRHIQPDLLLLNEMPFGAWVAGSPVYDEAAFDRLCVTADHGEASLAELGPRMVLGTRPRRKDGRRVNEGFIWTADGGYVPVHTKQYFPEEPGFHESRWFEPGESHFRLVEVNGIKFGFLICTELMFNEHARAYGKSGADIICVPRATETASLPRWRIAAQMAAMVSGAWVLSSNRSGSDASSVNFGGAGWIIDPLGTCIAETTCEVPVAIAAIDVDRARRQKGNYPLYVPELPIRTAEFG